MYKFKREKQISFTDFNQPLGLQMNPDNRWIKKAEMIPWDTIEDEYAKLFPSHTGMPAKPLRMALGSLLIQKQYHYPDEELVEQIRENPYYQYFIGLPGYEDKIPFVPSLLVEFRKRLSEEVLNEINEMIIEYNVQKNDEDDSNDDHHDGNADQDTSDAFAHLSVFTGFQDIICSDRGSLKIWDLLRRDYFKYDKVLRFYKFSKLFAAFVMYKYFLKHLYYKGGVNLRPLARTV